MHDMNKDPRFWALWAAIWFSLLLAIENIIAKVSLLSRLSD